MKILFIGDIFGECGLIALENEIPSLVKKHKIDFIIANAENTSKARGLTYSDYKRVIDAGVNFITMGNHTWHKKEIADIFSNETNIIRPLNIASHEEVANWGVGTREFKVKNKLLRVTNLIGTSIPFNYKQTNPFIELEELLKIDNSDIHIIDFHAETTSEKNAFFLCFKGKVSAILGTHTHVQTADFKIMDNTFYITDVGMTGPSNGIIGAKPDSIIAKFRGESERFRLEEQIGPYQFSAVILEFDNNNLPKNILPILKYQKL